MKTFCLYLFICILSLVSCKSSKVTDAQINALKNLVESKNYTIESDWAYPQVTNAVQQVLNSGLLQPGNSANAINLIGNSNFLTISGDSINSYLPYFGERQMNIGYGGQDSGIALKTIMEDYSETKGKHDSHIIRFSARNKSETFDIIVQLFPSLKSEIRVNSSSRFPISYIGQVEPIKK